MDAAIPRAGGRREATVVRAPNHLGDVVMALPALAASGADVVVARWLAPVLEMAGLTGDVLPLDRGPRGFLSAVRALRRRRYRRGVLLSAAFSAAWLFRCGGVKGLRGTRTDGRGWLLHDAVDPTTVRGRPRGEVFGELVGHAVEGRLEAPRVEPPPERVATWRERLGARGPLVALLPGANAPARRWPTERFGKVAAVLAETGRVVILGGETERELTAQVAAAAPDALDLGGATDLVDLAAVLRLCDLVVTNDTGPMHLAGAVGTPTVSLWGSSDPGEVRQSGAADWPVTGAALPCKPCYRNHCHRRGAGTVLADAHVECMRLIEVQQVVTTVRQALAGSGHA